MARRFLPAFVLCCLLAPWYANAEGPRRSHDITVEDYFTQATLLDLALAPDGRHVAYTEGRWQQSTNDRKEDLWVVETKSGKVQRLTFDRPSARLPQWSPDSRHIYFAANRKREGSTQVPFNGKTQVWRVGLDGGEPRAVTRIDDGIRLFRLGKDGHSLYYVTDHDHEDDEWKQLREQFKDVEYGHGRRKVSRVWKLDLENWRTEKLIDDKRYYHDFAPSPDGKRVALIAAPDDRVISFEGRSRVEVFDVGSGKVIALPDKVYRADAPSPYGWLERLAWSADSAALAFNIIFDGYPAEVVIAEWVDGTPSLRKLDRPDGLMVRGYGSPLAWQGKARKLAFLGERKAQVRVHTMQDRSVDEEPLTPGAVVVENFSFSESGEQAAVLLADATHFPDIHLIEGNGKSRQLTNVNPQMATWKLPRLSTVEWKGADGVPVQGVLELPPDYQEGQKLPLVVEIHGGPTTATYAALQFWIYGRTLLPAKGYALLSPNYRGSTGYGDKFLTDLIAHENDRDVRDILAGVEAMVESGIADPERLGVMGWSNGGYLTNCVIAKTTRFKAASSGAGIVDTVMEWGSNDEPAYAIVFKKGFPWNAAANYHKTSPTYQLDRIRTPTLIHVGGNDERCPPAHSRMLYRALKEYLNVPTQLCLYPGEPHSPMTYRHRKAKMEWDLAWFERYLHGKKP